MTDPADRPIPDDPVYLLTTDHVGHVNLLRADGTRWVALSG
jgi:hypothetical protein